MSEEIKSAIRAEAGALGFQAVGFAAASALAQGDAKAHLAEFLHQDRHGDMDWLARHADRRADPQALWPEARTVIALGMNYGQVDDPLKLTHLPERATVSVYARGRDYHDIVKSRLKRLGRWMAAEYGCGIKVFVDTAPVMEKSLGEAAGIGWRGKHTNLVSRAFGSWLFLGEVFTDLDIAPDPPHMDLCGSCRACIDACPTAALSEGREIDGRRCISYLTIEHKGDIDPDLREGMGNRVYGCDDCLAVCPWNKFAEPTSEPGFLPRIELTAPRLADYVQLDDAGFRQVFSGSPIKRTGRDRFVRNCLIAIGNSGLPELAGPAEKCLDDASSLVREAARWALESLGSKKSPRENAGAGICRED